LSWVTARLLAMTECVSEISSDIICATSSHGCLLQNILSFYNVLALHLQDCCKNITHQKKFDLQHPLVLVILGRDYILSSLPIVAIHSLREI
jgi:hypothetical protein